MRYLRASSAWAARVLQRSMRLTLDCLLPFFIINILHPFQWFSTILTIVLPHLNFAGTVRTLIHNAMFHFKLYFSHPSCPFKITQISVLRITESMLPVAYSPPSCKILSRLQTHYKNLPHWIFHRVLLSALPSGDIRYSGLLEYP